MKLTAAIVTGLLAASASASIVEKVQDIVGSAKESLNRFSPLSTAVQIPCCSKPPCPGCPLIRGNNTLSLLSVSYPGTGLRAFEGKPPGCGEGFTAEDCVRFFQVTLLTLDKPLEIAAEKAEPAKKGDLRGCGEDSTPGECLRYLRGYFQELQKPVDRTLGAGSVTNSVENDGDEYASETGKSEL